MALIGNHVGEIGKTFDKCGVFLGTGFFVVHIMGH